MLVQVDELSEAPNESAENEGQLDTRQNLDSNLEEAEQLEEDLEALGKSSPRSTRQSALYREWGWAILNKKGLLFPALDAARLASMAGTLHVLCPAVVAAVASFILRLLLYTCGIPQHVQSLPKPAA